MALDAYTGTYVDSLYGEATILLRDGRLVLERGDWSGPLDYLSGENFTWTIVPASIIPRLPIKFDVGPDGAVQALSLGIFGDVRSLRRPVAGGRGGR